MSQLTLEQKREIAMRLGYRMTPQEGADRHELTGPDGRHRGMFRPSKAADLWIWNDAVFHFELFRDRAGAVHRRLPSPPGEALLERVWPGEPERHAPDPSMFPQRYERLSGSTAI